MIEVVLAALGVAFAAFAVWLAVRIINRRERWAKRLAIGSTACLPLLYVLSFGPACWFCLRYGAGGEAVHVVYRPLIHLGSLPEGQRDNPGPLPRAILWYANLGAS